MYDKDDDELRYETTDLMAHDDDLMEPGRGRSGLGALVFFIILAVIAIGAAFYIFVTKTSKIDKLTLEYENFKNESAGRDKVNSDKIADLEKNLGRSKQIVKDLGLKGEAFNNELVKTRKSLDDAKDKIQELNEDNRKKTEEIDSLKEKFENESKLRESSESTAKNTISEYKRMADSLSRKAKSLEEDVNYWKNMYQSQMDQQEKAVDQILKSAKSRERRVNELEEALLRTLKEKELYYSLISWEDNYRMTNRVPESKLTQQPRLLTTSKPYYPESVKNEAISGAVILKGVLNEQGIFDNIEVLYSPQDNKLLSQEAIKAARMYRYRPAYKNEQKVKTVIVFPVEFSSD
ncbi:MAG: TonB family protein [Acidobacteria bacterium]|nr:TonB family protein [Acidobacteriota bacterium]